MHAFLFSCRSRLNISKKHNVLQKSTNHTRTLLRHSWNTRDGSIIKSSVDIAWTILLNLLRSGGIRFNKEINEHIYTFKQNVVSTSVSTYTSSTLKTVFEKCPLFGFGVSASINFMISILTDACNSVRENSSPMDWILRCFWRIRTNLRFVEHEKMDMAYWLWALEYLDEYRRSSRAWNRPVRTTFD